MSERLQRGVDCVDEGTDPRIHVQRIVHLVHRIADAGISPNIIEVCRSLSRVSQTSFVYRFNTSCMISHTLLQQPASVLSR